MSPRPGRAAAATLAAALLLAGCASNPEPRDQCEAMADRDVPGVAISATRTVTDRQELPWFCRIRGTIDPDIGFEARLPLGGEVVLAD